MAVSAQRRRRVLVAVVAALIAAGAFYLAIEYTNKAPATTNSGTGAGATAAPVTTATVVEASAALPAGTLLTAANLKTAAVSTQVLSVLTAAGGSDYPTIAALTASKEYAATTIVAGLPILSSQVSSTPSAAAATIAGLPAVLPSGYVAFALPYNPGASTGNGMGTGGFITSGDRIDILVTDGAGPTNWAYENVLVLAIGQSSGAPASSASASPAASGAAPAPAPDMVMVELSRQDAAAMAAVEDQTSPASTIQYLIVSSKDYPSAGASAVPAIGAGPGSVTAPNSFFAG